MSQSYRTYPSAIAKPNDVPADPATQLKFPDPSEVNDPAASVAGNVQVTFDPTVAGALKAT